MATEVDDLLRRLRDADRRQDWAEVTRLSRAILALQPGQPDARAFLHVAQLRLAPPEPGFPPAPTEGFVGRVPEMARLRRALEGSISGAGRAVMLMGEPGVGKTRTAEELSAYAALREVYVLWGRVHEETDAPPYWPWVQVLRGYIRLRRPEDPRAELGAAAGVIASIVPELAATLPGTEKPPALGDTGAERFRLFDSVTSVLKAASAAAPLLVVLDNLHWADEPSLRLLEFAAQETAGSCILIVGTYRDVELTRTHPLSRTLAALTQIRGFERVLLRGLSEGEVESLIERVSGATPPEALTRTVHARTEGNPLFVTEVIRLLAQEGKLAPEWMRGQESWSLHIPEGVREAVGRRLDHLSGACNRVLIASSVAGREFGADAAARLVEGLEESEVLAALEQARAAHLVEEIPNTLGRYRFIHKLVQETLEAELSTTQRVRLHARIVEVLEGLYGEKAEEHAEELARHCAEAHLVLGTEKLVRYSLVAGKRADEVQAWEEAYAIYRRAIDAKGEGVMDEELAALYRGISTVLYMTWHMDESARIHRRLFEHAEARTDLPILMQAVWGLTNASVFAGRGDPVPYREYALRALRAFGRSKTADPARLLQMARLEWTAGRDYGWLEQVMGRVLCLAEEKGDPALKCEALTWWGIYAGNTGRLRTALELWERAEKLGVGQELRLSLPVVRHNDSAEFLLRLGEPEAARVHVRAFEETAQRSRSPRWGSGLHVQQVALAIGDWGTVRVSCARGLEILGASVRPAPEVYWLLCHGALAAHEVGEGSAGDAYLEQLAEHYRDAHTPVIIDAILCATAVFPAVARITGAARWLDLARQAGEALLERDFGALDAVRALGLIAVLRGDAGEARQRHDELLRVQEDYRGWFARSAGLMAIAAGDVEAALAHFEESYAFTRNAGYRPEHAWCCCDQADALLARGAEKDTERAQLLLVEGRSIACEMGMRPLEARIALRLDRLSSRLPPLYPDGLTEREVQVLRLVANGLTNKEIAFELSISINTVATHLKHVLEKTGAANRAEATAHALKRGIISKEGPPRG